MGRVLAALGAELGEFYLAGNRLFVLAGIVIARTAVGALEPYKFVGIFSFSHIFCTGK